MFFDATTSAFAFDGLFDFEATGVSFLADFFGGESRLVVLLGDYSPSKLDYFEVFPTDALDFDFLAETANLF